MNVCKKRKKEERLLPESFLLCFDKAYCWRIVCPYVFLFQSLNPEQLISIEIQSHTLTQHYTPKQEQSGCYKGEQHCQDSRLRWEKKTCSVGYPQLIIKGWAPDRGLTKVHSHIYQHIYNHQECIY